MESKTVHIPLGTVAVLEIVHSSKNLQHPLDLPRNQNKIHGLMVFSSVLLLAASNNYSSWKSSYPSIPALAHE